MKTFSQEAEIDPDAGRRTTGGDAALLTNDDVTGQRQDMEGVQEVMWDTSAEVTTEEVSRGRRTDPFSPWWVSLSHEALLPFHFYADDTRVTWADAEDEEDEGDGHMTYY